MRWGKIWGHQKRQSLIAHFGALLYPPRCIFCRKILERDGICYACRKELPFLKNMRVSAPSFIYEAYAVFSYEAMIRSAILRYKFHRITAYAKPFAELMQKCIELHIAGCFDCITWVPISAVREHERGFDQSQLLAKEIAQYFCLPIGQFLRKIRHNTKQSEQATPADRHVNVIGAYQAVNCKEISGKRILLVDDVMTTGATLSECARTLKNAGAEVVYSIVIAKTKSHKKKN